MAKLYIGSHVLTVRTPDPLAWGVSYYPVVNRVMIRRNVESAAPIEIEVIAGIDRAGWFKVDSVSDTYSGYPIRLIDTHGKIWEREFPLMIQGPVELIRMDRQYALMFYAIEI